VESHYIVITVAQEMMSKMNKLRGAVIGVGYLGNFHAQKVKGSDYATLVGVYDQYAPQAEKIANELQVKAFKSLEEIPSQVDFVTIAAATQAHYDLAKFFLSNHIPVLVGKAHCGNK
jgi:predicted dehydrogenase